MSYGPEARQTLSANDELGHGEGQAAAAVAGSLLVFIMALNPKP